MKTLIKKQNKVISKKKKPLILIKYNVNPELHHTTEHQGEFKDCTEPRSKFFSQKQWEKALMFYLECAAPITTVQQIAWAIPAHAKKALVTSEHIVNWVKFPKTSLLKKEIK